ncbi:MAG: glycosyltransferase [bacterium]|nr:glycosyltransferase [bacterium]
MRICLVANNLNPHAGWGRLVSNVAEKIKTLGHEVGFILEKGVNNENTLVVPLNLKLSNLFNLPGSMRRVRRFAAGYDAVISYDINPYGIVVSLAMLGLKKKKVAYAIATYSVLTSGHFFKNMLMRWAYQQADAVWSVSKFVVQQIEKSGYKIKTCEIIPVGVDTSFFKKTERSVSRPIPSPYILSVGALKYRKGFHVSIPAFAAIAKDFPDLKYVIIGDQDMSYAKRMKALAAELQIEDRIIFLEKISDEDLLKYYYNASLFVLTPITTREMIEGFGMVYLEAGACARPVVGTLDSGAEAAIVEGVTGFLAQPEAGAVAIAMRKILENATLAASMGANGVKRAAEFDWDKVAGMYVDSLQKLLRS